MAVQELSRLDIKLILILVDVLHAEVTPGWPAWEPGVLPTFRIPIEAYVWPSRCHQPICYCSGITTGSAIPWRVHTLPCCMGRWGLWAQWTCSLLATVASVRQIFTSKIAWFCPVNQWRSGLSQEGCLAVFVLFFKNVLEIFKRKNPASRVKKARALD